MASQRQALFPLGQVCLTHGAIDALKRAGQLPEDFLARHVTGDWGALDIADKRTNDHAVNRGERILSAYYTNQEDKLYIITEWDRSSTTILLPEEY